MTNKASMTDDQWVIPSGCCQLRLFGALGLLAGRITFAGKLLDSILLVHTAGAARVAVVDIDVHHGNGTQAVFYEDPTVLYVSSHQYPYYPGTGAAEEIGAGAGRGFTVNIPLAAGATDAEIEDEYERVVLPALDRFQPEALLVSAGFDAHYLDPLAGLRLTTAGYARLIAMLDAAAGRLCDGRIAFTTEGGYHLTALRECLEAIIK